MLDHTHLNPTGWKARADRAAARLAANRSPRTQAIRKARAAINHVDEVSGEAKSAWARLHAPVPCPIGQGGMMHPQMADLLLACLAEKGLTGHNPLEPVEPGISCEDFVAEAIAAAQAELDAAYAELAEIERQEGEFAAIMAAGPEGFEAVLAGRAGSPAADDRDSLIEPAVDPMTHLAPVTVLVDETETIVPDEVPPRRGPGRPRRVDLDDDVPA